MIRKSWLIVTVSVLGTISALAQTGGQGPQSPRPRLETYIIRGKIITGTGREGDMRIEVRLDRTTLQIVQMAYSDTVGNFEFRNLSPGMYWVSINHEGFEPFRESVELYPGLASRTLSVFLNRAPIERPRLTGLDAADPNTVDIGQMKENFPRKATQNFEKAMEEKKKGQTDRAIQLLEEAVQIAPTFYHAHNNLGILYQIARRYADAEKEYQRARELNQKSAEPLTNLGSLFIEQSDERRAEGEDVVGKLLDDALDVLERAVKIDPRSVAAHYYLGAANYKSSFYEEADAALTKALALDPMLGWIRLMLANVYLKQNRLREVVETLDAYLLQNPKANDRAAIEETRDRIQKGLEAADTTR